ncbi:Ras family [seawater metagenome]|uniref:Ras family n=1 Tax=seawater metagenome TaxID=1561972 RepID=A0A5E8CK71_9ZZZZ
MDDYDFLFKIILIGETSVGKSSIVNSYLDKEISNSHETTIGVDFRMKMENLDSRIAKLQIWDTAGQEKFRAITRSYYRGAHAILIVFDITNRDSFLGLEKWFKEIDENATINPIIFLIGNKTDLDKRRQVSYIEALEFAQKKNISYKECSAKTANYVDEMFNFIANRTFENCKKYDTLRINNNIKLIQKKRFFKCCN